MAAPWSSRPSMFPEPTPRRAPSRRSATGGSDSCWAAMGARSRSRPRRRRRIGTCCSGRRARWAPCPRRDPAAGSSSGWLRGGACSGKPPCRSWPITWYRCGIVPLRRCGSPWPTSMTSMARRSPPGRSTRSTPSAFPSPASSRTTCPIPTRRALSTGSPGRSPTSCSWRPTCRTASPFAGRWCASSSRCW